jgi:hypothetical protein
MAQTQTTFTLTVEHDDAHDGDTIGSAVDTLLETALSTPGILDELGNPEIGQTGLELHELLRQPDTDDATYILREVYKHMGLPIPAFLEVAS